MTRIISWKANLLALAVAQVLTQIAFSFVMPFTPLFIQTLGVSSTTEAAQWSGVIGASTAVTMAITQPMWGNLADRVGHRPMVLRAMIGGALTIALQGLVTAPWQLVALRLIQGTVVGSVFASNALVSTTTPRQHLGFALGMMQVAILGGTAVGPLFGGVLADTLGYRDTFYVCGAILMLGAVVVIGFCQDARDRLPSQQPRMSVLRESRALLALGIIPVLIGILFLVQFGNVVVSPVLTLFVAELNGDANAATISGIVLASTGAVSAISALLSGRYGERIGPKKLLSAFLLVAAVSYLPQAAVTSVWQLLLLRMLLGASLGGLVTVANTLVVQAVSSDRRGAAFGLTATGNSFANAIAPIAGAALATAFGIRTVFLATGMLFVIGFVWLSLGLRRGAEAESEADHTAAPASEGRA